jgi:two-component system response regulator WspF
MRLGIANAQKLEELPQIIRQASHYEIAWLAREGKEVVTRCAIDTPDLILMDVILPNMDGVEATQQIMNQSPCSILVVTNSVNSNAAQVFQAMRYGALDAVDTPSMGNDAQAQHSRKALFKKINTIAKLLMLSPTTNSKPLQTQHQTTATSTSPTPQIVTQSGPPLIVIGSSTGGPKALAEVLSHLPKTLGATIVIIQHLNEEFSPELTNWLDRQCSLKVRLAVKGEHPEINTVYVASTNDHLILTRSRTFAYTPEPRTIPYRPWVDTFFNSVAKHWPQKGIAVLLTCMGRDGAQGLVTLRKAGWHTIAQDEASSVVYGMPKAAKELGAAIEILPVEKIGAAIEKLCVCVNC